MAMTPEQMIDFFEQQAHKASTNGMQAANASANYYLASINCSQAFKCRLMKGLIEWRTGKDPSDSLSAAVEGFAIDWQTVVTVGGGNAKLADGPAERVAFVAYLIGKQCAIGVMSEDLKAERLLDFVLGTGLNNSWNDMLWDRGMKELHQIGSDLAVKTYELYKNIIDASESDLPALSKEGERLFFKRKSDSYYRGGDQTEGGDYDNNITVDYRLSSLLKRVGFRGTGEIHAWKW